MIKINLLRNKGDSQTQVTSSNINYETAFDIGAADGASGSAKSIFTKLIIMFVGVMGLMLYEYYNISDLQAQVSDLRTKNNVVMQELEKNKPIASKARELQKQIQDLEARIQAIKDLSKVRLREIKAIDYIQNVIPERVWLTSLDISGENMKIEGGALSDDQLNRFMDSIDGKSYFRNVILLRAVEQKNKEGTIKMFQITSSLTSTE